MYTYLYIFSLKLIFLCLVKAMDVNLLTNMSTTSLNFTFILCYLIRFYKFVVLW